MRPRVINRLLPLLFVSFSFSVTAIAQNGQIDGELIGPDGQPLRGAAIVMDQQRDGTAHYELETDQRGDFTHVSVIPSFYQIIVQMDGQTLATATATTSQGSNDMRINLQTGEIEYYEYSRVLGTVERVVRPLSVAGGGGGAGPFVSLDRSRDNGDDGVASGDAEMRAAFEAGLAAMQTENYEEAIRQFTAAAVLTDTQHVVHANLARAYEMNDQHAEAAASYEEAQRMVTAQEIGPEQTNYYGSLTLAYAMAGDVEKAMEYADTAAAIDPSRAAQSFYDIGAVLTNRRNNAGAVEAFRRAVEADPAMADAHFQIAIALIADQSTIPEAIPSLERYLEIAPNGPNAEAAQGLLDFARQQGGP
jgi:Flp pilus assembly protein TadD